MKEWGHLVMDMKTFDVDISQTVRRRVQAIDSHHAYDVAHNTDDGKTRVIAEQTEQIYEVENP